MKNCKILETYEMHGVAVQPDGKIVVVDGSFTFIPNATFPVSQVLRYNTDGTLNTTFDGDGIVTTAVSGTAIGANSVFFDVVIQPDGKIVAAGNASTGGNQNFAVVRYNANGSLDTSFGNGGKKTTADDGFQFYDVYNEGKAVALEPDGKIVVAGEYSFRVGQQDVMVLRLLGEGGTNVAAHAKFDFDGDGKSDVSVFRLSNGSWYLQRSQLGFTGVQFGVSTDLPTPGDYDGDGKTDVAVYRPSAGAWYLNRTTQGFTGVPFGAAEDLSAPKAFVRYFIR